MSTLPAARREELLRLRWPMLGIGATALILCAIGAVFHPAQFFRAYLTAYLFYLGIAHGCFAILMLYYLTGGAWGFLIRRILEAGVRTLPLLALLFLPIAGGVVLLYPWAQPDLAAATKEIRDKQTYLNVGFFWIRAVLYFALWLGIAFFLNRWSRQQEESADPRAAARLVRLSGPGLAIFGITITFASVDWVMSIQPGFRSTIFGPWFATGELLSGHACALLVLGWLAGEPPLAEVISPDALNDLGNLLFTFLVVWAYLTFFQFMLIWIANIPYDVSWYTPRGEGGWRLVAWAVLLFQFTVPFFLLLQRNVKRNPRALAAVAGLVLGMHLVYTYYQVMPSFVEASSLAEHWMDFLTPLGLGGLWVPYFLWQLQRYPVLPRQDPNLAGALHLHDLDLEQAGRAGEVRHG
jgi:hypothetical protein